MPAIASSHNVTLLSDDPNDLTLFNQTGSNDLASDTYRLLFAQLSDINFELEIATSARIAALLKQDKTMCALNRIKTAQRSLVNLYSYPIHLYPSHRLYYYQNNTPILPTMKTNQGALKDLSVLFARYPKAIVAVEQGRSYDKVIDEQLSLLSVENVVRRSGGDAYRALIDMFSRQRVDFILTYPTVFKHYFNELDDTVSAIAIAKHPEFVAGHIACTDTRESRAIINKINQAMISIYRKQEYLDIYFNHLPKSDHDLVTRRISDLFVRIKSNWGQPILFFQVSRENTKWLIWSL